MPRILCMGCEKEIGLNEIPFCMECVQRMDPDTAREHELKQTMGHLKGRNDHMLNVHGKCVSWCPACSGSGESDAR